MICYARTHRGHVRPNNEDAVYIPDGNGGNFVVVADGMGGHKAGEEASRIVVESVRAALGGIEASAMRETHIRRALENANRKVWQAAAGDETKRGMGSTATVAAFSEDRAIIGNVGDSRAYLFRDRQLLQITKDHSYVQTLIDSGTISKEDAAHHPHKNIITRAIGAEETVIADTFVVKLKKGDVVLLCSDGLNNVVPDKDIQRILSEDLSTAADRLVDAALAGGGIDNISVVIVVTDGGAA